MKKFFLFIVFTLYFSTSVAMEKFNKEGHEKSKNGEKIETAADILALTESEFPCEISELLIRYFDHGLVEMTIKRISEILDAHHIKCVSNSSIRQFESSPVFDKLGYMIKNCPSIGYTKLALLIVLSEAFSYIEQLHFLGIMKIHENLTKPQKIILDFSARACIEINLEKILPIKIDNLVNGALSLPDFDKTKILITWLLENGASLPEDTFAVLFQKKNDLDVPLEMNVIRWFLSLGAKINVKMRYHESTLLEYCYSKLEYWSNEIPDMLRPHYKSKEEIDKEIEYYKELIALLETYTLKSAESVKSEIEEISE